MAIFKPKVKDTTEYKLQKVFNLGREEALKEVLKWLDEHTYDEQYLLNDTPDAVGIAPYHTKEAMLRSFKERFNIE